MAESIKRDDMRSVRTFLWPAALAITVAALVLLILALGHWWPSGSAWYLPAAVALVLLLVTGATWVCGSIYVITKYRRWAWWMGAWPLVTVLGVALALVARPDFEDARPQFEEVARQLLATREASNTSDLTIGRFDVLMAYDSPEGDVFFSDARTTIFNTEAGWAFSPDGAPTAPAGDITTEHISGPWYRYELVTTF